MKQLILLYVGKVKDLKQDNFIVLNKEVKENDKK